jgi:hypothetical protein
VQIGESEVYISDIELHKCTHTPWVSEPSYVFCIGLFTGIHGSKSNVSGAVYGLHHSQEVEHHLTDRCHTLGSPWGAFDCTAVDGIKSKLFVWFLREYLEGSMRLTVIAESVALGERMVEWVRSKSQGKGPYNMRRPDSVSVIDQSCSW